MNTITVLVSGRDEYKTFVNNKHIIREDSLSKLLEIYTINTKQFSYEIFE